MKITVAGLGYVGLPLALLLAQRHEVTGFDTDAAKIDMLKSGISPVKDGDIMPLLAQKKLRLLTSPEAAEAYGGADFIIVAAPTDYDEEKNVFNTSSVNKIICGALSVNRKASIVVKSTVPIGFTENAKKQFGYENIYFSPEFLREGSAVYDNRNPSRIIVGNRDQNAESFAALLKQISLKDDVPVMFMGSTEAETVKLFSNTYLALRVAFFNELDTFADSKALDTLSILRGVCADSRIGNSYNNPSFGYGGYCLPKDSKQLAASFGDIPNDIIKATVAANATRIKYIAKRIMDKNPRLVGVYRLTAKAGSDNFRQSAILGVMNVLKENGIALAVYEPLLKAAEFNGSPVIADLNEFKQKCGLIICNRKTPDLADVMHKVYTKDLFGEC